MVAGDFMLMRNFILLQYLLFHHPDAISTMPHSVSLPKEFEKLKGKLEEDFLIGIKDNYFVEQLFQGRKYNVWGLPFFNDSQRQHEFTEAFNSNLLSS